jgi:hypothetical protein
MHSTWDGEDAVDKEDAEEKVVAEDVAKAHHLQPKSKTKRRVAVDVATPGLSLLRQEGQE